MDKLPYIRRKTGPKGPTVWTKERIEQEIEPLLEYANSSPRPLLEEIAVKRGYNVALVSRDFVSRSEKFSHAYVEFKHIQKTKWVDVSLTTKNQAVVVFLLKNFTDMKDEHHVNAQGFNQIFNIAVSPDLKLREGNRLGHHIQAPAS